MIPFDAVMMRRAHSLCARIRPHLGARGRVLDVGSGTGHTARALAVSTGLEVSTADVVDMRVVGPAPVIFDGERLPFADDAFDHALVIHVLQYPCDAVRLLREAARVAARSVVLIQSTCRRRLGRVHLTLHEAAWGRLAYRTARTAGWVKPPPPDAAPLLARRALSPEALARLLADARLRPVAHARHRWWSRHVESELYVLERQR